MCVHFFNFDHLRITLQSSDLIWGIKFCVPYLLPPFIFSYLQALIYGFLWWWVCSWLIFSLKWHLQSFFFLLHSGAIDLQEEKDFIDEEDPRPTNSTWSYITWYSNIIYLNIIKLTWHVLTYTWHLIWLVSWYFIT